MSGILKIIIIRLAVPIILCVSAGAFWFFEQYFASVLLIISCFYYFILNAMRKKQNKKLGEQAKCFGASSDVRNVKYLIIGDMYRATEGASSIQISAPDKTLDSCYQILRHTHSILGGDDPTVIIAVKRKNIHKSGYSVFDIPFFHYITIKKLHLEELKVGNGWALVLKHPISTLKFVFDLKSNRYKQLDIDAQNIKEFCKQRGYRLIFKVY